MKTRCLIWNTPADYVTETRRDGIAVNSPRAGGRYFITSSAVPALRLLDPREKMLLTSWLVDQRRSGSNTPEIDSYSLNNIRDRRPLRFSEKTERILKYCEQNIQKIGDRIEMFIVDPNADDANRLAALTECQDLDELSALIYLMGRMELIDDKGGGEKLIFAPNHVGWSRIEQMQTSAPDTPQAFVAMWFHESTEEAYRNGIHKAIEQSGYRPIRIDRKQHVNKIDDEIIAEIRRSRFLVADFTCESEKVRGGVYFETGFAMALGIPVIWTCSEKSIDDLHFDTRQYNHIVWKDSAELFSQLRSRIGAVIGDGPLKSAAGIS